MLQAKKCSNTLLPEHLIVYAMYVYVSWIYKGYEYFNKSLLFCEDVIFYGSYKTEARKIYGKKI